VIFGFFLRGKPVRFITPKLAPKLAPNSLVRGEMG
jgi:hypothetical protein